MPNVAHFAEAVVDWVCLPRSDPDLFVPGTTPRRAIEPPDWPIMAVRIDFSAGGDQRRNPLRDVCSRRLMCLQVPQVAPLAAGVGPRVGPI